MFSQSLLNEIRDRIPMSSLIGERVILKKAGRNFKGLCPFHQEKTPSFMVSDEKQIYHCFGCGEGGDLFSFMMKYEGLNFAEAVKNLAERCGVTVPEDQIRTAGTDAELSRKKKLLFRVNQIAMEWFQNQLNGNGIGQQARNYLISRGIKSEIWTQLNLGVADKSWDALCEHLRGRGVPLELAAELGLIRKRTNDDGYYDFFRGRLMFPIFSPRGEVIAFSGRTLEGEDNAKYLNSPDSMIFHKSMSVYGLNWAAEHIRREDRTLVVEGQMDVIGLIQGGLKNVVAPLGTALTSGHVRLLTRTTRNIVLVFDGDEAGKRAAIRALPNFLEVGIMPRVATLPLGEDPDSLVRKGGPDALGKVVGRAASLFDLFLDETTMLSGRDAAGKVSAMANIVPILKQMRDTTEQRIYGRRVADKLDLPESIVSEALVSAEPTQRRIAKAIARASSKDSIVLPSVDRVLIELMVQHPELAPRIIKELRPDDISDGFCRTILSLFNQHYAETGRVNVSEVLDELADPDVEKELRELAFSGEKVAAEEAEGVLADCLTSIKTRPVKEKMLELNDLIRIAESEGNDAQLYHLLRRKKEMARSTNSGHGNQTN